MYTTDHKRLADTNQRTAQDKTDHKHDKAVYDDNGT
jgi:hypothetical protein